MIPKQKNQAPDNPLDAIADHLALDMKAVNREIIERMQSPVALIPQLASYLIAAGGKRIRPLLTLACTEIFGGDMKRAHRLSASVEFIHTATLLHDDVVDESAERRGQATANMVFGNQASVLVGDFLFSRAFQLMVDDGSLDVLRTLSDASAIIAQGEVLQLATAGNINSTMDHYLEIISAKTAALFAAACEVGPLVSSASPSAARAMAEYGLNLGIAFQIADDALDYSADQKKLGKNTGDDFAEGKITAPVFFALREATPDEKTFWESAITQKNGDLATAQAYINKYKGVEKSLDLAKSYAEKAQLALAEAPDHPLRAHLHNLATYAVFREF